MTPTLISQLAVAIALLGACIAWGQWYTARQKLVLDLHEKRLAVFNAVEVAIKRASSSKASISEWDTAMFAERARIRFLFGAEVERWISQLHDQIGERIDAMGRIRDPDFPPSDAAELEIVIVSGRRRLLEARREWVELCAPYLRMDQKLPRPPSEWPGMFIGWVRHRYANRSDGSE